MSKIPSNLADKIEEGLMGLGSVSIATLLDWAQQDSDHRTKDVLGDEIIYRQDEVIAHCKKMEELKKKAESSLT